MIIEARGILSTDKIKRLIERVKDFKVFNIFCGKMYMDKISGIRCGASLAHHGLFGKVITMGMEDVDLSSVPTKHLVSLTSSVRVGLCIQNVIGCDLVSIFSSLRCGTVVINNQSLGREETRALVQHMETREISRGLLSLKLGAEVTLDIEALVEYSGEGVCKEIELNNSTMVRYIEELRTWARSKNWEEYLAPLMLKYQTLFKRLD